MSGRGAGIGLLVLVTVVLGACAAPPPTSGAVAVDDVLVARERQAERFGRERVERLVQSEGRRIAELELPAPAYRGTLPEEQWAASTEECIREQVPRVSSAALRVDASGELVGWSVRPLAQPGDSERLALAVRVCAVRYLPSIPGLGGIDEVERAWWSEDARTRFLPCLRRAAAGPVPMIPEDGLAELAAQGRPWDPLRSLDLPAQRRAAALCPPGEVLLERAQPHENIGRGERAPRPARHRELSVTSRPDHAQ